MAYGLRWLARLRFPDDEPGVAGAPNQEIEMGKYVIGWILGVPAIVLVVLYFFFG